MRSDCYWCITTAYGCCSWTRRSCATPCQPWCCGGAETRDGKTAYGIALEADYEEVCRLLLEYGGDAESTHELQRGYWWDHQNTHFEGREQALVRHRRHLLIQQIRQTQVPKSGASSSHNKLLSDLELLMRPQLTTAGRWAEDVYCSGCKRFQDRHPSLEDQLWLHKPSRRDLEASAHDLRYPLCQLILGSLPETWPWLRNSPIYLSLPLETFKGSTSEEIPLGFENHIDVHYGGQKTFGSAGIH
jgi:hypothetical protein